MVFIGDDEESIKSWRIDHNWRQVEGGYREESDAKERIRADHDVVVDKIELASLDPQNGDFLRPIDSALANGGVGGDLPHYAGAVPPPGTETWDWDKTWRHRVGNLGDDSPDPGPQNDSAVEVNSKEALTRAGR